MASLLVQLTDWENDITDAVQLFPPTMLDAEVTVKNIFNSKDVEALIDRGYVGSTHGNTIHFIKETVVEVADNEGNAVAVVIKFVVLLQ